MLSLLWDTRQYFFWLMVISVLCFVLERILPWRKAQRALRNQFGQDLFWLVFNGHYLGILLAHVTAWLWLAAGEVPERAIGHIPEVVWLPDQPLWVQFLLFLTIRDFVEWLVHNLLHKVPFLWEFHKLHHSIEELDWIGNFRFHWMEVVVYRMLTYLPLVMLDVSGQVILWVAIVGTLIGHLNHSNIRISWGPLKYVLNSSRMHAWHHDEVLHGGHGQNFGVILSVWDWVFGTAYLPDDREQPDRLGFEGFDAYPRSLVGRLVYPFWKSKAGTRSREDTKETK
jgi:sterol desaturase/sphingolipid hydroxylase (fatty acid hydroxylase superfamily)